MPDSIRDVLILMLQQTYPETYSVFQSIELSSASKTENSLYNNFINDLKDSLVIAEKLIHVNGFVIAEGLGGFNFKITLGKTQKNDNLIELLSIFCSHISSLESIYKEVPSTNFIFEQNNFFQSAILKSENDFFSHYAKGFIVESAIQNSMNLDVEVNKDYIVASSNSLHNCIRI